MEAADVVDVEEELAEVAEEEGEDEQDEDARQLGLAARRRRRHGRVGVLRQIQVGYGPLIVVTHKTRARLTVGIGTLISLCTGGELNLTHASSCE